MKNVISTALIASFFIMPAQAEYDGTYKTICRVAETRTSITIDYTSKVVYHGNQIPNALNYVEPRTGLVFYSVYSRTKDITYRVRLEYDGSAYYGLVDEISGNPRDQMTTQNIMATMDARCVPVS